MITADRLRQHFKVQRETRRIQAIHEIGNNPSKGWVWLENALIVLTEDDAFNSSLKLDMDKLLSRFKDNVYWGEVKIKHALKGLGYRITDYQDTDDKVYWNITWRDYD